MTMIMTIEYENQVVNCYTSEKDGFALQIWLSSTPEKTFSDAQEMLMMVFEMRKIKRLISDLRLLGDLSPESIHQANLVFNPWLQQLEKVASIVREETFVKMLLENSETGVHASIYHANSRLFTTLESALAWMRED